MQLNIQTVSSQRSGLPIIRGCEENIAVQRMDIDALDHFVVEAIALLCYGVAEIDLKPLNFRLRESHESAQITKRTDSSKSISK